MQQRNHESKVLVRNPEGQKPETSYKLQVEVRGLYHIQHQAEPTQPIFLLDGVYKLLSLF